MLLGVTEGVTDTLGVIEGVGDARGTAGCGAPPRMVLGAEALTLVVSSAPAEAPRPWGWAARVVVLTDGSDGPCPGRMPRCLEQAGPCGAKP